MMVDDMFICAFACKFKNTLFCGKVLVNTGLELGVGTAELAREQFLGIVYMKTAQS